MNTTNEKNRISPPYLSVAKFTQALELVSTRNVPQVSIDFFANRAFNNIEALLAVNGLKFLGLISDNGQPTEQMAKLRLKGDARKKEFEKIVRAGYRKLFEAVDSPQDLPPDELYNEFVAQYGGLSERLAKPAVRIFLKLCEFSGLKEESAVVVKKRTLKVKPREKVLIKEKVKAGEGPQQETSADELSPTFSPIPLADGRFALQMPTELKNRLLDDEKLNEDWRLVVKAIRSFADKYWPKENESGDKKNDTQKESE